MCDHVGLSAPTSPVGTLLNGHFLSSLPTGEPRCKRGAALAAGDLRRIQRHPPPTQPPSPRHPLRGGEPLWPRAERWSSTVARVPDLHRLSSPILSDVAGSAWFFYFIFVSLTSRAASCLKQSTNPLLLCRIWALTPLIRLHGGEFGENCSKGRVWWPTLCCVNGSSLREQESQLRFQAAGKVSRYTPNFSWRKAEKNVIFREWET